MVLSKPVIAIAAAVATAAALTLLEMPGRCVPAPVVANQDKLEHVALFALLVALWRAAGLRPLTALVAAAALAIGSEALQGWLGMGRTPDPIDALADLGGASFALAAWALVATSRWRRA